MQVIETRVDTETPRNVFGGRLSLQKESTEHPVCMYSSRQRHIVGVPEILVELVKVLRDHGLDIEGIYRVPGRSSRLHNFINYVNANPSVVSGNLAVATEPETLDSRTISSAIKRFLSLLPESVLNAEELLCAINERLDDREAASLTPVKLARILMAMQTFLEQKFEETLAGDTGALQHTERKRRMATLDFIVRHLRDVASLQAHNHMSPRALSLCLAPSLFGCPKKCRTNSLMLELMIEHWPWLTQNLKPGSQRTPSDKGFRSFAGARRYAYQFQRHRFFEPNQLASFRLIHPYSDLCVGF